MNKDLLFERLFGSNRSERLFDKEESSVASFVYDFAYDEIHAGQDYGSHDFDTDSVESFDDKIEATMIRFERVADVFKKSCKAKNNFLRNFRHWAPHCKETIKSLRDIAEELKADKFNRDVTRLFGSVIGAIGGTLACLSLPVSGPLVVGGGIAFALANGVVVKTTTKEIAHVEKNLKKVRKLIEKEKERFTSMTHWFSRPEELENSINSLMDYNILNEIAKEVQKLTEEVTGEKDITEDEFKNQFQQVLKHCMGLMAKDNKMIEEHGKEFAPAVMTFVFMVSLMNDHNRIALDCSWITQHLALGLMSVFDFGALAGELIGGSSIAKAAVSEIFVWYGVAVDVLIAVLSIKDICKQPETKHTEKIKEVADKIEKVFLFIESVYNKTKTYKFPDEATQCTTVLVRNVPDDAGLADLKMAVKHCLPEEALGRIKILRLPTEENNWLVKVPASHSQMLLQQTEIKIKEKNCLVTH